MQEKVDESYIDSRIELNWSDLKKFDQNKPQFIRGQRAAGEGEGEAAAEGEGGEAPAQGMDTD